VNNEMSQQPEYWLSSTTLE